MESQLDLYHSYFDRIQGTLDLLQNSITLVLGHINQLSSIITEINSTRLKYSKNNNEKDKLNETMNKTKNNIDNNIKSMNNFTNQMLSMNNMLNNMTSFSGMNNMNFMNMSMPPPLGINQDMMKMTNFYGMPDIWKNMYENFFKWHLYFLNEDNNEITTIDISEEKTVKEAIDMYLKKSNRNRTDDIKFFHDNKELNPDLKLSQSGLKCFSKIVVVSKK